MTSTKTKLIHVISTGLMEFRILRRLTRAWVLAVLLTLTMQLGYILACWYLAYHLPYDPTAGINAPKYLLGNIDPTILLFFNWALLLIQFDLVQRHDRHRIAEVIDTEPATNLEVLVGRVVAVTGSLWVLVAVNILVMQFVGSFSIFGWNFAETLQWHSVVNLLLIDGPVNLLFWSSFLILLSVLFRNRLLLLLVGATAMFCWYWLIIRSSYSLVSLVSPSGNDTLLVSEITPGLPSFGTILIRISYVLFSAFFLACGAYFHSRLDGTKPTRLNQSILPISLAFGVGAFFLGAWSVMSPFNQFDDWKAVHAEYEWTDDIDVLELGGTINIDPHKSMDAKYIVRLVRKSGSTTQPFVFTLNPGLNIQSVEIDGVQVENDFNNGLLEIPNVNVEIGKPIELVIEVQGRPKANFAYLDSVVNYLTDPEIPAHLTKLLGKDGTIYSSSYVALMPGAHWYPTPGPVNTIHRDSEPNRDFFEVNLSVALSRKDWSLVASAQHAELSEMPNTYEIQSGSAIPELGIFASRFEQASIEISGIHFSMYLHAKHTNNLHPITDWNDTLREKAYSWIDECQELGLAPLEIGINFVEIPRSLRTVGGGWRMDAVDTLPGGLILLKEHGFPRAKLQLALARYIKRVSSYGPDFSEVAELAPLRLLTLYFDKGKGTDAPWTSLNKLLWKHQTAPMGEYAESLDQVVNWLLTAFPSELSRPKRQFSIYSTMRISDFTMLQYAAARQGVNDVLTNPNIVHRRYESDVNSVERTFIERSSIWSHVERNEFSRLRSSNKSQMDLEASLLKSREIAEGLLNVNGQEKTFRWIDQLRQQYHARNFTYVDFISSAKEHEVVYAPFLTDWITKSTVPAFLVHGPSIRQISNDDRGDARYQTTFVLENKQPVEGHVELKIPTMESAQWSLPMFEHLDFIQIDGNSALRVKFLTAYKIGGFKIQPGLSFNRRELYYDVVEQEDSYGPSQSQSPFTEVVDSPSADRSILVDDLDEGFIVNQISPRLATSRRFGPLAWINSQHTEIELDKNLPIQPSNGLSRPLPNYWQRRTQSLMEIPFGRFRQSFAYVWAEKEVPIVEFKTNLTEAGKWQLDYHYPWFAPTEWMRESEIPEKDALLLVITQNDKTFKIPLDVKSMSYGWNRVERFELSSDPVSAKLVYRPKPSSPPARVYADAIRWTKIER
ncbi:MAG: hypothetical protein F4X56_08045 [Gammaproteobacteria bacterium]|nr:hypothetical protein [Gammaproteobacteria bacterium]MYC25851.1 hypothetical protein [Gammaproteobacteria bacterium]